MNVYLIVDMEEQYLTDDDYMGLMSQEYWDEVRAELKEKFEDIIEEAKRRKAEGWCIHFTGETEPYGELVDIIDERLPYWANDIHFIHQRYPSDVNVLLTGLFYERCVYAVSLIIPHATIDPEFTVSHGIIGDSEGWFYNYDYEERLGIAS